MFGVESIGEKGARVRRVLEADPQTGQPRLADDAFFYTGPRLRKSDLAYAVTGHKGQGGTVSRGLALVTGREPLQWLYVAMTRGRDRNTAIAVGQAREADPQPGTRPDPELARSERVQRERDALPAEPAARAEEQPG